MRAKKAKTFNVESKVRSALRKVWLYSPQRAEALRMAKAKGVDLYFCQGCKTLTPKSMVQVDHVVACGSIKEVGWDVWIDRLFNGKLQVLCKDNCHRLKTQFDKRSIRRMPKA